MAPKQSGRWPLAWTLHLRETIGATTPSQTFPASAFTPASTERSLISSIISCMEEDRTVIPAYGCSSALAFGRQCCWDHGIPNQSWHFPGGIPPCTHTTWITCESFGSSLFLKVSIFAAVSYPASTSRIYARAFQFRYSQTQNIGSTSMSVHSSYLPYLLKGNTSRKRNENVEPCTTPSSHFDSSFESTISCNFAS